MVGRFYGFVNRVGSWTHLRRETWRRQRREKWLCKDFKGHRKTPNILVSLKQSYTNPQYKPEYLTSHFSCSSVIEHTPSLKTSTYSKKVDPKHHKSPQLVYRSSTALVYRQLRVRFSTLHVLPHKFPDNQILCERIGSLGFPVFLILFEQHVYLSQTFRTLPKRQIDVLWARAIQQDTRCYCAETRTKIRLTNRHWALTTPIPPETE